MKNTVLAIGVILAAASGAQASFSNMEMWTDQWGFPLSPGDAVVSFPQFNTQGGTRVLKGVQIDLEGAMLASVTAENNSDIAVNDFAVQLVGIVDFSLGASALGLGIVANSAAASVTATDNGGVPNGSGTDFHDFGTVSGNDTDSTFLPPFPAVLAFFQGGGTVNGSVSGNGGFSAQGSADATINFDNFGASGTAKVTYFYDLIPTPGSFALAGLAGLAIARRRRA